MEKHRIEDKYNNTLRSLISQLEHFNFENTELKYVKKIFTAFAQASDSDPILATGPFIRMFEDDILEDNVEKLLNYNYETHIYQDCDEKTKELIINLIRLCKMTWVGWTKKNDKKNMLQFRSYIVDLLISAMEYGCPIQKATKYEEYEKMYRQMCKEKNL